ncbi:hypothetical protein [Brevundimonas sp.]|uniref:hypothetical protein n=1 Tax=Brevundimonas sp. TaxID=1871086 RepID=UPI002FCB644A
MIKTILVLDDDAGVRAAALHCLKSASSRIAAIVGADDPDELARRYPADLLVFGSVDAADGVADTGRDPEAGPR